MLDRRIQFEVSAIQRGKITDVTRNYNLITRKIKGKCLSCLYYISSFPRFLIKLSIRILIKVRDLFVKIFTGKNYIRSKIADESASKEKLVSLCWYYNNTCMQIIWIDDSRISFQISRISRKIISQQKLFENTPEMGDSPQYHSLLRKWIPFTFLRGTVFESFRIVMIYFASRRYFKKRKTSLQRYKVDSYALFYDNLLLSNLITFFRRSLWEKFFMNILKL